MIDYSSLESHKANIFITQSFHDLRSPVVSIRNGTSLLQKRMDSLSRNEIDNILINILSESKNFFYRAEKLENLCNLSLEFTKNKNAYSLCDVFTETINSVSNFLNNSPQNIDFSNLEKNDLLLTPNIGIIKVILFNLINIIVQSTNTFQEALYTVIELEETNDKHIIKFSCKGNAGIVVNEKINKNEKNLLFDLRNEPNNRKDLVISKRLALEIGGDLKWQDHNNLIELMLFLPK